MNPVKKSNHQAPIMLNDNHCDDSFNYVLLDIMSMWKTPPQLLHSDRRLRSIFKLQLKKNGL